MQELITDLLELSRINRKGHAFKQTDLAEVVSAALSDLHFALEDSQGQVELSGLCTIDADPKQMVQLFQNLIGNSLKFCREGVPPLVKVSARIEDECCEIRVEDNGIGFDSQYQDRIFKVFERLHSRFKYEGTGIGLAICKKIVERHGGTIWAEGKPNEGAIFTIRLPVVQAASPVSV
jgi:signal transduction histidine kinase